MESERALEVKEEEPVRVGAGSDKASKMMKRVATCSFETPFFPCCQISPISQSGLWRRCQIPDTVQQRQRSFSLI